MKGDNTFQIGSGNISVWKIAKSILVLGIPLIVGELGSIAQQFADTIMVGRCPVDAMGHSAMDSLAAASLVNNFFYFIFYFTLGISYAVTPLVGKAFGERDGRDIIETMYEGVIINLVIGLICMLVLFRIRAGIQVFHQPQDILDLAKPYFLWVTLSVPFLTVFFALKQYIDGLGKTNVSMWIMLGSNLLNIFLNWSLIFGNFGAPRMGLAGAGIATFISRVVQLLVIITVAFMVTKRVMVDYHISSQVFSLSWTRTMPRIKYQFELGLPVGVQLGLELSIFSACGIFMGFIGKDELAAHQVMYTLSTFFFQILYGIAAAGCILISQFRGVGRINLLNKCARVTFSIGLFFVAFNSIILCCFFKPISALFNVSPAVYSVMMAILPWFILYQAGDCMQITYGNALRGLEDTIKLMTYSFITYVLITIPLCYLLGRPDVLGSRGVWAGIPLGLTCAGLLFMRRFRKDTKCNAANGTD